jgi:hypothetical protein
MKIDDLLQSEDGYSAMLDLAVHLAEKAAVHTEDGLSHPEQTIRLAMWIECQVCNGGWEQWLFNTSTEGIRRTLKALAESPSPYIVALAEQAVAIASIHPEQDSDDIREQKLNSLTEQTRKQLEPLDAAFYSQVEAFVEQCRQYALKHKDLISW